MNIRQSQDAAYVCPPANVDLQMVPCPGDACYPTNIRQRLVDVLHFQDVVEHRQCRAVVGLPRMMMYRTDDDYDDDDEDDDDEEEEEEEEEDNLFRQCSFRCTNIKRRNGF